MVEEDLCVVNDDMRIDFLFTDEGIDLVEEESHFLCDIW